MRFLKGSLIAGLIKWKVDVIEAANKSSQKEPPKELSPNLSLIKSWYRKANKLSQLRAAADAWRVKKRSMRSTGQSTPRHEIQQLTAR
jgi:hypothetical protein